MAREEIRRIRVAEVNEQTAIERERKSAFNHHRTHVQKNEKVDIDERIKIERSAVNRSVQTKKEKKKKGVIFVKLVLLC